MSESIIDPLDYKILRVYHNDPFQSYHAISKIVDVHHSTVGDRIASMKERGILQQDKIIEDTRIDEKGNYITEPRPITEVFAVHSPASMGMTRVNILFKRIRTLKDYNILRKFCRDHPYAHYISQLYGRGVTLFAQFDIPNGTLDLHIQTFKSLQGDYVDFEEFEIFADPYEAKSKPKLEDQVSIKNIEPSQDENFINLLWDGFIDRESEIELVKPKQEKKFDNLDAELIREIGWNARVNISGLTDYYNRNKSTLSRRLSKIQDYFIDGGKLRYGYQSDKLHGFNNTQIVTGKFDSSSDVDWKKLTKFVNSSDTLPFDSFITIEDNQFLFYSHATIGVAGDIMDFLYKKTDPFHLSQYQFYITKSSSFPFWHGNYDENEGYKVDRQTIMDGPLEDLKSLIQNN